MSRGGARVRGLTASGSTRRRVGTVPEEVDVLVLGGGPAGAWAAVAAATSGARVALVDKGYCGTSGAAASGGNNLWYLPPEGRSREQAIRRREAAGGHLTDRRWMARTLDETWRQVARLAAWGYPYPVDEYGVQRRGSLQGPEYMKLMRRQVLRSGAWVIDQSPALELLTDADGVVTGAAGVHRQPRAGQGATWRIRAGAVVLATGGCAFGSSALGLNVDTGDGQLMAAELGAELSGMEFSCAYAISPILDGVPTSGAKGLMYQFARYYDADGRLLDIAPGLNARVQVARELVRQPVLLRLDEAPPSIRANMRLAQPNFFLPFDKAGVDPFEQLFPVRLVLEGTVRGTGGLRLWDDGCATSVPGLFAAGDVASREVVTGGVSGGGSHNGAWAISSGTWAGSAAARFARARGGVPPRERVEARGRVGLVPEQGRDGGTAPTEVVRAVQAEVVPLEKNFFRTAVGLERSLTVLDDLWSAAVPGLGRGPLGDGVGGVVGDVGEARDALRAREAAAMVAHARWMYRSALLRDESRAMHLRDDAPQRRDPELRRHVVVAGLDRVEARWEEAVVGGAGAEIAS